MSGLPDAYELIVSTAQLIRICEAMKAYDTVKPLTLTQRLDCNLEYLTDALVATLGEKPGDGVQHGICL